MADELTLDEFFAGYDDAGPLFDAVRACAESLGTVRLRVTRSQVALSRRIGFAWAWMPDRYLGTGHAPLVLSVALRRRDASLRWKEVVEPAPGLFMHHLEVREPADIDDEVRAWLEEAWKAAG